MGELYIPATVNLGSTRDVASGLSPSLRNGQSLCFDANVLEEGRTEIDCIAIMEPQRVGFFGCGSENALRLGLDWDELIGRESVLEGRRWRRVMT